MVHCPQELLGRLLPVDNSEGESEAHTPIGGIEVAKLARQGISSISGGRGTRPISKHPLFPAMIALWFAALFGLGSLAIRPTLVESLVRATGIERAIPAVAPPLDLIARAEIALALAILGGLLGLILGRMIPTLATRRSDSQPEPFTQPRKPFSAQELAEVTFDEPLDEPESELTGEDDAPAVDATPQRKRPQMVDLTELQRALLSEKLPRPVLVPAPEPAGVTIDLPVEPEHAQPTPPLGKAAQRLLAADLATLTPVELVERLGISMQLQRTGMPSDAASAPVPRPMPEVPLPRLHAAPPARVDNEQVLRSALAALQRLSGAA